MRVLVTGAAGCLGRAVVERLVARGHRVRGFDRVQGPAGSASLEWVQGDLLQHDADALCAGCDAVAHLAALVHQPEVTDLDSYRRVNTEATERLLVAARRAGVGPGRFAFASTVGVYGRDHDLDADEDTPVAPRTPYAISKLEAEKRVAEAGGVTLRFPLMYGPGDRGNMAQLIRAVARGRFVLPGACERPRSVVASGNAAEAISGALDRAPAGRLFLATDAEDPTVRRLVHVIQAAVPDAPPVRRVPYAAVWPAAVLGSALAATGLRAPVTLDALRKLTTRLVFSSARARSELGYAPPIGLEDGIRNAVSGGSWISGGKAS